MRYCHQCGTDVQDTDAFCPSCGAALRPDSGSGGSASGQSSLPGAGTQTAQADVIITPMRILIMSILTYGLYLFYWFYLTWKHYRNHTNQEAYPVWHALTLLVPIYGFFRTHAHVRTYKDLMATASVPTTLNALLAVVLVIISSALDWASFWAISSGEVTRELYSFITIINLISIGIVMGLILQVQNNLNMYWNNLRQTQLFQPVAARIGVGEVIFGILGVLSWSDTLASLFSESYRLGV